MLSGPNERAYAVAWFGSLPFQQELAKKVSPLTYVRKDVPPTLIIHGDADPIVPRTRRQPESTRCIIEPRVLGVICTR